MDFLYLACLYLRVNINSPNLCPQILLFILNKDLASTIFIVVAIFYFLLIRPQNKRRKEHQSLISALNKGDEIVTAGGIVGKINKVEEDFVILQVSNEVEMRLQKTAVGATLPKGTIKSLDES